MSFEMLFTLPMLGFVVLLAQTSPPTGDDLWRLGVIAVAMLVGAAVTYRYTTLPERDRASKAELRAEASEAREREALKSTLPALVAVNAAADRMLAAAQKGPT